LVVDVLEPDCPSDCPVEHRLATQTGADAPTGAATDTAGLALVELVCTAPTDSEND
jgi:hypothetical protein